MYLVYHWSLLVPAQHHVHMATVTSSMGRWCSSLPGWCLADTLTSSIIPPWMRNRTLHCLWKIKWFFFPGQLPHVLSSPLAGRNNFKWATFLFVSIQQGTFNFWPCNSSFCPPASHEEKLGTLQTDAQAHAIASAQQKAAGVSGIIQSYQHSQVDGSGGNAKTEIGNVKGKKANFQHTQKQSNKHTFPEQWLLKMQFTKNTFPLISYK